MKKYFTIVCLLILAASHGQGLTKTSTFNLGSFKKYKFTGYKLQEDSLSVYMLTIHNTANPYMGGFSIYGSEIPEFIKIAEMIRDSIELTKGVAGASYNYDTKEGAKITATYVKNAFAKGWDIGLQNLYKYLRIEKNTPLWVTGKNYREFIAYFKEAYNKLLTQ